MALVTKEYYKALFDYHYTIMDHLWGCIIDLSEEQYTRELDYSVGSIQTHCQHMLATEDFWLTGLTGGVVTYPDLTTLPRETLRAKWQGVKEDMYAYLDTLDWAALDEDIQHPAAVDQELKCKRWEILTQLINHATDHRAQILAGIHHLGGRTFQQDYIIYAYRRNGYDFSY